MRKAKDRSEWDKAAMLAYTVASMVSRKVSYEHFHPYLDNPGRVTKDNIQHLKRFFDKKVKNA